MKRSVARAATIALIALNGALPACKTEPEQASPERVVEEFVARMQRVHGEPKAAMEAYELLWSQAKRNLAERAKRASAVTGRKVGPEEMIAPSRFSLRYKPRSYSAAVQGDWAAVTITGEVSATQRSTVHCVLEGGQWRVVLDLPPLAPIQQRADAGTEP
jgi:hypothetical protein